MASVFKSALDHHVMILEEHLAKRDSKERDKQEKFMSGVSQLFGNLVSAKLEEIVSTEIKKNILPGLLSLTFKEL